MLLLLVLLLCLHLHLPTLVHIFQLSFTHSHSPTLLFLFAPSHSPFTCSHLPLLFSFTCPSSFTSLFVLPPAYSPAHHCFLCLHPFVHAHAHLFIPMPICLCMYPFFCAHMQFTVQVLLSFIHAHTTLIHVCLCPPLLFVLPGTHSSHIITNNLTCLCTWAALMMPK